MGDLGDTISRQGSAFMRDYLIYQLVGYFVNGCAGCGAMQVRTWRVAKIKGLAGGEVGRKKSAQLFHLSLNVAEYCSESVIGSFIRPIPVSDLLS